jgi:hypothetical protein
MKKIATLLIPLALTFALANSAYATCDMSRLHVVRSEGAPGGFQIFDLAPPTVLPTFYFRFTTDDPTMIAALNAAWVAHSTVRVLGNAASCPTTGTIRFGGVIAYVFRDSFF